LNIRQLRFLRSDDDPVRPNPLVVASAATPVDRTRFSAQRRVDVLEVLFGGPPVDQVGVVDGASFVTTQSGLGLVHGLIFHMPGNVVRFYKPDGFGVGNYEVTVRGGAPGTDPAARSAVRLDGEPTDFWPTGEGAEGGDYVFHFDVTP
jgi:hypothetical protein